MRTATIADWPLIETFHRSCSAQALYRRWGRAQITRRDIERLLHHSSCWIALLAADKVVALGSAGPLSRQPGVFDLGLQVADAYQRRGIGLAVARHAVTHARSQGAHTLSVYTEASNLPMLGLVRHLGHSTEIREGTRLDVRVPLSATDSTASRLTRRR
ncbi:GNAT family N-acetyltransferase [Streptomyces sp. ICC1]|nr:GNAT family N-acetyltransferase [Streptomyces sp. ICC4]AWZ18380.1 GNAT family N-acetyltransferase [Streptomyces sp. ICC1]